MKIQFVQHHTHTHDLSTIAVDVFIALKHWTKRNLTILYAPRVVHNT